MITGVMVVGTKGMGIAVARSFMGWFALLIYALATPAFAQSAPGVSPEGYKPPEFWNGVRAGDSYDKVKSLAGWYQCGEMPRPKLCTDIKGPDSKPEVYELEFQNNKAFLGAHYILSAPPVWSTYKRFNPVQDANTTLLEIGSNPDFIDFISENYHGRASGIVSKAARLLAPENDDKIYSMTYVNRPFVTGDYRDQIAYREILPAETFVMRVEKFLWKSQPATRLRVTLSPADRKILFPEYCMDNCKSWKLR